MSGQKRRGEPGRSAKSKIRNAIFERDGFYWQHGEMWMAFCAFGCGELIWGIYATLDHHPVKQRDGGRWTTDNLRLACRPCNSADRNHKELGPSKRMVKIAERKALRREARIKNGRATKADKEFVVNTQNYLAKLETAPSPNYPNATRQRLRENYPRSADVDRNGIPIRETRNVVYDVAKGKFVYEKA